MTVTTNPNVVIQKRLEGDPPEPLEFYDFVEKTVLPAGLVPNPKQKIISITGDVKLSGQFTPEVRQEAASLPQEDDYQVLQGDIKAQGNTPRLILQVQPGLGTVTFKYQNIPNDSLRKKARELADEWLLTLQGQKEKSSRLATARPPVSAAKSSDIMDRYELKRQLGRGHSAEVWRARVVEKAVGVDLVPDQEVALKIYTRLMENSTDTVRVQREFQVATELEHPNLVRVFDLVLSPSRPWHNFLAMELVNGRTLKSLIPRDGMEPERIVFIAKQIFGALNALHVRAALHRDVKAANIMITEEDKEEKAKLCDLGIVSVIGDKSFTGTSVFLGSKHSAPLEQMTGEEVDYRTDVYAAGSVMYYCLKGHPMYHRAGPEGAIVRRMLEDPARLDTSGKSGLKQKLAEVINQCIEVDPADRPASAREVLELLDALPVGR